MATHSWVSDVSGLYSLPMDDNKLECRSLWQDKVVFVMISCALQSGEIICAHLWLTSDFSAYVRDMQYKTSK